MKRTGIRSGPGPRRNREIARGAGARGSSLRSGPMPGVNRARKASEFTRCYHSRARVRWVKALPCCVCVALSPLLGRTDGSSHNAHTVGDGASRKAGYETIAPLCASHHRRYDEHQRPFDDEPGNWRRFVKDAAIRTEALWRAHVGAAAA